MVKRRQCAAVGSLLVAVFCSSSGRAEPPSGVELLDSLRSWDQVFMQGIYVESDAIVPPSPFDSNVPARATQIRCTWWDNNFAIENVFVAQIPGTALPAVIGGTFEPDSRETIPLRRFYVFDNGKSSSYESVALEYEENGAPVVGGKTRETVLLYNPDDDNDITPALHRLEWSLGRGFSEHIEQIDEVSELENGLLHVSGSGRWRPGEEGRWELQIDQQAGLLVRKAEFFNQENDVRVFTVSTEGVFDVGDWIAARMGKFALRLTDARDSEYEFSHQVIRPEPDTEFFEATDVVFSQPLPHMSIVHDNRGEKEEITRVGGNKPGTQPAAPPRSGGFRMGIVIAVNLVAVAIVLLLLGVRAARKQPKQPDSR
jgi:hypothetical protein